MSIQPLCLYLFLFLSSFLSVCRALGGNEIRQINAYQIENCHSISLFSIIKCYYFSLIFPRRVTKLHTAVLCFVLFHKSDIFRLLFQMCKLFSGIRKYWNKTWSPLAMFIFHPAAAILLLFWGKKTTVEKKESATCWPFRLPHGFASFSLVLRLNSSSLTFDRERNRKVWIIYYNLSLENAQIINRPTRRSHTINCDDDEKQQQRQTQKKQVINNKRRKASIFDQPPPSSS